MDNRKIRKLAETAVNILIENHGIIPSSSVVIVTDKDVNPIISKTFQEVLERRELQELDLLPVPILTIPLPNYSGEEPQQYTTESGSQVNAPLSPLLTQFDVAFLLTSISITHIAGSNEIQKKPNGYVISIPGMSNVDDAKAILNTIRADPKEIKKVNDVLSQAIGLGPNKVYITSPSGTDLFLEVPRGNWKSEWGKRHPGLNVTNGAAGELFTCPVEANGVFVIPTGSCLTTPIGMITEEIRLIIEYGSVTKITGEGQQAQTLRQRLEDTRTKITDPLLQKAVMQIAEFSLGTNKKAPRKGRSVIVEKAIGTIHVAIGSNDVTLTEGYSPDKPPLSVGIHIDCIIMDATVVIDGKTIMKAGRLQVAA